MYSTPCVMQCCLGVVAMRHLSDCYRLQGRLEETMELAQNALEMATSSLSSTHPEMGGCKEKYCLSLSA